MPGDEDWVDEGPKGLAEGAILLSSFPSAGLAATVAAHYIVQTLHLPRIGALDHPDSASLAIIRSGHVEPPVRIHGRPDLGVILSELPVSAGSSPALARRILQGANRRKVRRVIALEGVIPHPAEHEASDLEEIVWSVSSPTSEEMQDQLTKARTRPLEDGVIGGVSGALLLESLRTPVAVSVLLVSALHASEGFPDHRAGATLIETLDRLLPELKIETGPLRTQAEAIERGLRAALKSRRRSEGPAESPISEPTIYG
ncbi:MAG TPA: PAC2 family protein [Thermoplasmata archaeon]|nr:PAC2 family protein [Thermoplasmata archaeon]